ncbi:MAG: ISAs1 family transposase [Oceanospirillales bacterium]|nr:ISAs1 family transposase [Oceanospirillales bacterium]
MNAWASEASIALGQYKIEAKSNEINAVPELLETLAIQGYLMTLDAMGCQKHIANTIRKKDAGYLLAVKSNQHTLHKELSEYFDRYWDANPDDAPKHPKAPKTLLNSKPNMCLRIQPIYFRLPP